VMKKVGPETSPTVSTWPVHILYVMKMWLKRLPLLSPRGLSTLYT
jgi:hypothetical protein